MRFTYLFVTAVCILSVNAVSLTKRAISDPVQLCRDDIVDIWNELKVVKDLLEDFTSSLGYNGISAIHTAEQALEEAIKKANVDCCVITTDEITIQEVEAVLDTVTPVIPQATSALDLIVTKKPEVYKVLFAPNIVKTDLTALNTQVIALYTCVHVFVSEHPTYIPTINNFISQLDNSFAISLAAYQNTRSVSA